MIVRWIYFFVAILFGIIAGILIGWFVLPAQYIDTSPDVLRVDYQTDYVLMTAEAYAKENNLAQAVVRLTFLGKTPPQELVQQAILFAEPRYADADLTLLRALLQALQLKGSDPGGGS